jgi:hypothetical protein
MDRFYHKADAGPVRIGVGWLSTIGRDRFDNVGILYKHSVRRPRGISVFPPESGAYLFPARPRFAGMGIARKAARHRLVFN